MSGYEFWFITCAFEICNPRGYATDLFKLRKIAKRAFAVFFTNELQPNKFLTIV